MKNSTENIDFQTFVMTYGTLLFNIAKKQLIKDFGAFIYRQYLDYSSDCDEYLKELTRVILYWKERK
jgi:hypothetical protein